MASDAFIHAGFNGMKTLWRSTPNGRETESTIPAIIQRFAEDRFPGIARHVGWWPYAREVFDLKPTSCLATGGFIGVSSIYKHCGSTAETNLDIAIAVQPAKTGEHPALSDPVKMIGSIPLWAYRRHLMQPIHSH
jgi:hypothetical protein